ncbi:MAG: hypothetical protein HOK95_03255 [Candidatus Marinimicrobia bacterium]|nr:hypothetical protein [Candidatus Neomarinimicrobiota bacterium]
MSDLQQEDSYNLASVKLTNTWGHETQIGYMIEGIDIYESVFTNGTKGSIVISDNIGLIESLPFLGEETIEIDFYVWEGDNYTKTFNVYSIESVDIVKGNMKTYILNFISSEVELNKNTRISKAWKGVTNDEIVSDIFTDFSMSIFYAEPCITSSRLVVPNWTPFRTMQWLAENSVTENGASDIVFYENKYGWWWQSLSKMKEKKHAAFLHYLGFKEKTNNNRNSIRTLSAPQLFNTFNNTKGGLYGSTTYNHSIINKSLVTNYLYAGAEERIMESSKLGKNPPMANRGLPDNFEEDKLHTNSSKISDALSDLSTFKGKLDYQSVDPETVYHKKEHNLMRDSTLQGMNTQIINVEVAGDPGRMCGNPITLMVGSMIDNIKGAQEIDDLYSGVYLMTAIHHSLTKENYTQIIELRSDSIDRKVGE